MSTETMTPAEQIRNLREKTGAGMMDCKRALEASGGDFEGAVAHLRKTGLAAAAKKASRTTKEGLITAAVTSDGKAGSIVELNCETDFVAKTDEFPALAKALAVQVAEGMLTEAAGADEQIKTLVAKLGENMGLGAFHRYTLEGPGRIGFYVHTSGSKKGALVELSCSSDEVSGHDAVAELVKELGMQIVAMSPRWVRREDVPADEIAKERDIFETQVRKEGKPEAALPKIVEGKLNKLFFAAYCLLEQVSVRDPKTNIQQIVESAAKSAGGSIAVKRFVRCQLGGE